MNTDFTKETVVSEIAGLVTSVTPNGITVAPFSKDKNKDTKEITLSHTYNIEKYKQCSVGQPIVIVTYKGLRTPTDSDLTRLDFLANYNHTTPKHPAYVTYKRVEIETPTEYKERKVREAIEAQKAREKNHNSDDEER